MKHIEQFDSFIKESVGVQTWVIQSTVKKSEWKNNFRGTEGTKIKHLIDKLAGHELIAPPEKSDKKGFYTIKTGDPDIPTLEIPERFVLSGALKSPEETMKAPEHKPVQ